jgi:hypothetical protein
MKIESVADRDLQRPAWAARVESSQMASNSAPRHGKQIESEIDRTGGLRQHAPES